MQAPKAVKASKEPVRYEQYRGQRKCDDCVALVYEQLKAGGSTRLIRTARVRRVESAGPLLLCNPHAQHRREIEAAPTGRK